MAPSICIQHV